MTPQSCNRGQLLLIFKVLASILIPCNSWLFLLRVLVIPPRFLRRSFVVTCAALWVTTFTSFVIFPAFRVSDIRTQDGSCSIETHSDVKMLTTPFIALVVFDTAVIIVISIALMAYNPARSWNERIKSMIRSKHMGYISKVFLQSGQIYYLYVISSSPIDALFLNVYIASPRTTIGIHLTFCIVALSFTISSDYVSQSGFLSYTYHNIMTCRVYRLLKLSRSAALDGSTFDLTGNHLSTIIFQDDNDITPTVPESNSFSRIVNLGTTADTEAP